MKTDTNEHSIKRYGQHSQNNILMPGISHQEHKTVKRAENWNQNEQEASQGSTSPRLGLRFRTWEEHPVDDRGSVDHQSQRHEVRFVVLGRFAGVKVQLQLGQESQDDEDQGEAETQVPLDDLAVGHLRQLLRARFFGPEE